MNKLISFHSSNRASNIKLYRIIVIIMIVAHHYIVNSGINQCISTDPWSLNSIYYALLGAWGKTGINCFVFITGYFMCKSKITVHKYVKLLSQVYFYNIVIGLIFYVSTRYSLNIKDIQSIILPIEQIGNNFTSSFLLFYLLIPFLNILIDGMTKQSHKILIGICVLIYSVFSSLYVIPVRFNYVSWFCVLYIISSYMRLYPLNLTKVAWRNLTLIGITTSAFTVLGILYLNEYLFMPKFGKTISWSFLVSDSNKILPLFVSVCSFMWFKNIDIKHSPIINTISASTFGVLLIHANCRNMKTWLWKDTIDCLGHYNSSYYVLYSLTMIAAVFFVCSLIDIIRSKTIEDKIISYVEPRVDKLIMYVKKNL